MDGDTSSKFIASLVKSIQALCNGYIDFSSNIEVIGHIHLRIDHNKKFNYILSEEVNKSQDEAATVFSSHSYHSQPPQSQTAGSGKATPASDSPGRSRRKTQQVPRVDESDALALPSLPADVPSATKDSKYSEKLQSPSCQRRDSGDSSRSGSFGTSDIDGVRKQENSSSACKQSASTNDSLNRRRRIHPEVLSTRSQDPAAKRSRMGGSGSSATGSSGFEVIEIKEEPDESNDFFADSNAAGQEISQPDFSNLVADSLDRVGQLEGASLLAGGDAQQIQLQQLGPPDQPFPVMLHANQTASTSSASSLPGPSDQPASSSGGLYGSGAVLMGKVPADVPYGEMELSQLRQWDGHHLARIPATKKKIYPQKRCYVCSRRGKRRDSYFHCPVCPTQPGLCKSRDCFIVFHQSSLKLNTCYACVVKTGNDGCTSALLTMAPGERYSAKDQGQICLDHHLARIPATKRKDSPLKRCRVCYRRGKRRDSYFHCPACPTQPGLCKTKDCFIVYHQYMQPPVLQTGHLTVE